MELDDQRESGNVEDRRGMGIGVGGGLGIGGIVIALVAAYFGVDPSTVLDTVQQVQTQADTREAPKGEAKIAQHRVHAGLLQAAELPLSSTMRPSKSETVRVASRA